MPSMFPVRQLRVSYARRKGYLPLLARRAAFDGTNSPPPDYRSPSPQGTASSQRCFNNFISRCSRRSFYCYLLLLLSAFFLYLLITSITSISCPDFAPDVTADVRPRLLAEPKSVAVVITATGKYLPLGLELIDSGRKFFCQTSECSNVTYLLFTDAQLSAIKVSNKSSSTTNKSHIIAVQQPRLGWPDDSMKRFHSYLKQHALLQTFDFILSLDADLRFVEQVDLSEMYGDLIGVIHPGYISKPRALLPFERDEPNSKAFVSYWSACRYFTGAVWGGRSDHFIRALRTLVWQLDEDAKLLGANFTAAWHDESHLNRYFLDNPPSRVLMPSYYYPDAAGYTDVVMFPKKIMALEKDHNELREMDEEAS